MIWTRIIRCKYSIHDQDCRLSCVLKVNSKSQGWFVLGGFPPHPPSLAFGSKVKTRLCRPAQSEVGLSHPSINNPRPLCPIILAARLHVRSIANYRPGSGSRCSNPQANPLVALGGGPLISPVLAPPAVEHESYLSPPQAARPPTTSWPCLFFH